MSMTCDKCDPQSNIDSRSTTTRARLCLSLPRPMGQEPDTHDNQQDPKDAQVHNYRPLPTLCMCTRLGHSIRFGPSTSTGPTLTGLPIPSCTPVPAACSC